MNPGMITTLVSLYSTYIVYKTRVAQNQEKGINAPIMTPEIEKGERVAQIVETGIAQYGHEDEKTALGEFEQNPQMFAKVLEQALQRMAQREAAFAERIQRLAEQINVTGGIHGTATIKGDNTGVNIGVNTGSVSQSNQTINNQAPNQGAQGTFEGPVTFNQQRGDEITAGRDVIQAGRDMTQVSGDYVRGDKISGDINVKGVSGSGIAIGHKGQSQVQQGGDADAFARAFAQVYQAITARPPDPDVDKDEIKDTVQAIQEEAQKGDQANERKLTRWLRTLAGMAEDIFDVTVAALTSPQAAFATVARKVAAKAKQEREQG
jgi:hypothetical protein